jgi:CHAD domain-containing protein
MAVPSTARSALTTRLAAVRDALTRVLGGAADDPERVHKLRVATRRATAAVQAFAVCLPERAVRRAKRRLRAIRRTAGAARDWDVFFTAVSKWAVDQPAPARPGLDALLGWAAANRQAAQAGLELLGEDHPSAANRLLSDTVSAVSRAATPLPELARSELAALLRELADTAAHDPADDAHLHRVRILGKRLRYAVEVFDRWLPPGFRDRLTPALKELQDVLGRFNDSVVAGRHLDEFAAHVRAFHPTAWERARPGVEALAAHHDAERIVGRRRFGEWRAGVDWAALAEPLGR